MRKGLILCVALAAGEALAFACPSAAEVFRPAACGILFFAALLAWGWRSWGLWLVCIACLGYARAGQLVAARQDVLRQARLLNNGKPFPARLAIPENVTLRPSAKGGTNVVFLADIGPLPVRVRMSRRPGDELPRPGEEWDCAGWLNAETPGRDGRRAYGIAGVRACARRATSAADRPFRAWLRRVRSGFSRRLGIGVPPGAESLALVRAILLGERARLPRETREAFARAGTIHVFAISGLHVMVVAQILAVLLMACDVGQRCLGVVLVPLVWLYVLLTGASPSAVRAAGMASLYFAAPVFGRAPNALSAWTATFLATHLSDPSLLLNVGSQLSFAVVLTLIFAVRATRHARPGVRFAVLTLATWAAGVPLVASAFGRFTLGGLVANLVLVPAAECAVIVASVGLLASYLSDPLAAYFTNLAVLVADVMSNVSFLTAALPGAHGETVPWPWYACGLWYLLLAGGLWRLAAWDRRKGCARMRTGDSAIPRQSAQNRGIREERPPADGLRALPTPAP